MSSAPRLCNQKTGATLPLSGRIVTIGSSRDCHIHLNDSSVPPLAAHLLFTGGNYVLQSLSTELRVEVNATIVRNSRLLVHGDTLRFGKHTFDYAEHDSAPASSNSTDSPLHELIKVIVTLLRNRDEDICSDLVMSIARLMRCDASRLVDEDPLSGERKTLVRYPSSAGLDRFSNRAIDWAQDASETILMSNDEWEHVDESISSLQKNLVASVLCAPLVYQKSILGYLYLDRIKSSEPFTEEDKAFCDALIPLVSELLVSYQERKRQKETIARLQANSLTPSGGILFQSEIMANLMQLASRLARTDSPVLILGETGTGKELMARFVHEKSMRSEKPFKAINCGAIPENLIESELFGHEKGAFTGAVQRKIGLFESAEGGTVFLDEAGELPLPLQVKLLRVLQESEVIRVGGTEAIRVNVRIVAATNKKLEKEVSEGRFRQDLYFRLNVLTIQLPALRERGPDISLLADYFVKKYCQQFGLPQKSLSVASRNELITYCWPGNIRELENVIQKAILLSDGSRIDPENIILGSSKVLGGAALSESVITLRDARTDAERQAIIHALAKTRGNVSLAGKILEIDRKWLIKKIEELDIDVDQYRI